MKSHCTGCDRRARHCRCCSMLGRRDFLAGVGCAALGVSLGAFDSVWGASAGPGVKPRVSAWFVRQKTDRYFMGWPGAAYDVKARQAEYTRVLKGAAKGLGVELELAQEPVTELEQVAGRMKGSASMYLWAHASWRLSQRLHMAYNSALPSQKMYDVYVSIKLEGPAYVPGSAKENSFSIDRMILVEVTE